jgi:hypothetical protein
MNVTLIPATAEGKVQYLPAAAFAYLVKCVNFAYS